MPKKAAGRSEDVKKIYFFIMIRVSTLTAGDDEAGDPIFVGILKG